MQDDVRTFKPEATIARYVSISEIIVDWELFSKSVCQCFKQDCKAENCVDSLHPL
jgi:hypothetical protein